MVRHYASEANERWEGFVHRPGDIVVSTRSRSGTTWMQAICALLVFQTPDLPAPLSEISPWVDWEVEPIEVVRARLEAQDHRRILKTHTPLDGLPLDPRSPTSWSAATRSTWASRSTTTWPTSTGTASRS